MPLGIASKPICALVIEPGGRGRGLRPILLPWMYAILRLHRYLLHLCAVFIVFGNGLSAGGKIQPKKTQIAKN